MKRLLRLLPRSLVARVFGLYLATLLFFFGTGLALFYNYQFGEMIEEAHQTAEMMMEVAAQSVADSAVIGDFDTIQKTLGRAIAKSRLSQAMFIDAAGALVKAEHPVADTVHAPEWLLNMVQEKLYDINRNIVVGGKDYGVMRFRFDGPHIASDLWRMGLYAMALASAALLGGVLIIKIPLRRWLGNFDRVREHEHEILSGAVAVNSLLDTDAPMEVRQTFDILNRAAARLYAQREEASVTLNAITDGVITTNTQNQVIYANPAAEQMLGLSGMGYLGTGIGEVLPAVVDELPGVNEWKVRRLQFQRQEQRLILDTTLSAILDGHGQVLGHVIACRDVTEAHALEQQLRQELQTRERALNSLRTVLQLYLPPNAAGPDSNQDNELEQLSNQVLTLVQEREVSRRMLDNQKFALDQHAIVSITDLQGNITYANERFCEISGYSIQELLGCNHRMINSGYHSRAFFENLWATIERGEVWQGEIKNRSKHGHDYWVNATIVPLRNAYGKLEQYIAIRTDITERKAFEAKLQDARFAAEAASQAKSDFLANMSHEIRTPMNGVIGMTELVLDTELSATQRDYLNIVKNSAESLLVILNDILDFSKIEAGKLSIESIAFSLPNSIAETLKSLTARARKKGLELVLDLPADLVEHAEGDPGRIRQVLNNLCDNAIKFTASGEITIKVREIAHDTESHLVQISVQDQGVGIPLEKQQLIFEAFSQADTSTTRRYGGTGLGLTICSRLTELMGGRIWVESEVGKGSIFHFTVRLRRAEDSNRVLPPLKTWPNMRALIADDHALNRQTIGHWLKAWGFAVDEAVDGAQALATCQQAAQEERSYALIVLDAQMPELDGFALATALRAEPQYRDTTLAMLTSGGNKGDGQRCRDLGIGIYLTKPATPSELREALSRVLDSSPAPDLMTRHAIREQPRKQNILLVEDHAINQLLATSLLEKWGHKVVLARNGQEAVDLFPTQAWDLVLMDMQMPVMGGLEATQRIRALEAPGQHTPIVAMTANAMEADRQACLDAGMDDHIAKPINSGLLEQMLRHYSARVGIQA